MQALVDVTNLNVEQQRALETMRELFKDEVYPDQEDPTSWFQLNDWTLLRYLKAKGFDVPSARDSLKNTVEFRKKYKPHLLTPEDPDVAQGLAFKVWRLLGPSKNGSPVQMTFAGLFNPSLITNEEGFVKTIIFESETILREMQKGNWKSEKTIVIFEMENYSLYNQASVSGMRLLRQMLEISKPGEFIRYI